MNCFKRQLGGGKCETGSWSHSMALGYRPPCGDMPSGRRLHSRKPRTRGSSQRASVWLRQREGSAAPPRCSLASMRGLPHSRAPPSPQRRPYPTRARHRRADPHHPLDSPSAVGCPVAVKPPPERGVALGHLARSPIKRCIDHWHDHLQVMTPTVSFARRRPACEKLCRTGIGKHRRALPDTLPSGSIWTRRSDTSGDFPPGPDCPQGSHASPLTARS